MAEAPRNANPCSCLETKVTLAGSTLLLAKSRIIGKLATDMEGRGPSGDAGVDAARNVFIKGFKEEQERLAELSRKMERAEHEQLVHIMGGISMNQQPSEPKNPRSKPDKDTEEVAKECRQFGKGHCDICYK